MAGLNEDLPATYLTFHHDSHLTTQSTTLLALFPLATLPEADQALFKSPPADTHIAITSSTIFHPQGGGQPSDTGTISLPNELTLTVFAARTSATRPTLVLHAGTFPQDTATPPVSSHTEVKQTIDAAKRTYYSRLHTAGHVLGAAVRHLLQDQIEGFDELKASHFPDAAACEFAGSIGGEHKGAIQTKLDEYLAGKHAVKVEWWGPEDFARQGLERLVPEGLRGQQEWAEKLRVVRIEGLEVYPCGGTHVDHTGLCGETKVKKISRSKGTSRVSYTVTE